MKKKLLICIITFSVGFIPGKIFAQEEAPGAVGSSPSASMESGTNDPAMIEAAATADPANLPNCNTLFQFKRNNGNGWGVCNNQAQITVNTSLEGDYPELVQVKDSKKQYLNQRVKHSQGSKGKVIYCLPEKNIPPAAKVTLVFATQYGGCKTTADVTE